MIAEIKMSVIKRPVQEGGMSEQGRALIQCGECFEHKWVRGGGGLDVAGQCEIKGVDNHRVRKDRSISVVCRGVEMILAKESVGRSHASARGDCPNDIKVLKKKGPASLSSREFARVFEVGQVFMISEDRDRVSGPL